MSVADYFHWAEKLIVFVGIRLSVLMICAPFFGSSVVPARIRTGVSIGLVLAMSGVAANRELPGELADLAALVIGELLAGFCLTFSLQLLFDAVQFAGHITGLQMGFSYANIVDPQTQVESTTITVFQQMLMLLIFLRMEVHHWALRALAKSFEFVPPGSLTLQSRFATYMLHEVSAMFVVGVQIAAPILVATLLSDLALAILGKVSAQLPVLLIGMSLKSTLGMFVLGTAMLTWPSLFNAGFDRAMRAAEQGLMLAR